MMTQYTAAAESKTKSARAAYPVCPVCRSRKPVALNGQVFCRSCEWSFVDCEVETDIDALLEVAMTLDWDEVLGPAPGMPRRTEKIENAECA